MFFEVGFVLIFVASVWDNALKASDLYAFGITNIDIFFIFNIKKIFFIYVTMILVYISVIQTRELRLWILN